MLFTVIDKTELRNDLLVLLLHANKKKRVRRLHTTWLQILEKENAEYGSAEGSAVEI